MSLKSILCLYIVFSDLHMDSVALLKCGFVLTSSGFLSDMDSPALLSVRSSFSELLPFSVALLFWM